MRRSSSTTMSALTGIDDDKHYVLMSSELEGTIELGDKKNGSIERWQVEINTFERKVVFPIISFEDDHSGGYLICVQAAGFMEFFTHLMLHRYDVNATLIGSSFNCKVMKLESDKAYLNLLR